MSDVSVCFQWVTVGTGDVDAGARQFMLGVSVQLSPRVKSADGLASFDSRQELAIIVCW